MDCIHNEERASNDDDVMVMVDVLWYTATAEGDDTATEAELMTTVNQQTSATDSDSSTVTADVTTVTDSQTLTGASRTPAVICGPARDENTNVIVL